MCIHVIVSMIHVLQLLQNACVCLSFMCVYVLFLPCRTPYYSVSSVIGTQSRATVHSKCKPLHTAAAIALLLLTHYAQVFKADITAWLHVGQILVCLINAPLVLPLGQMLVYLLPLVASQARS